MERLNGELVSREEYYIMKVSLFDGFFMFDFDWKAVMAISAALAVITLWS